MLTTTSRELHRAGVHVLDYEESYKDLGCVNSYGKDRPISYLQIFEFGGFDDCLRALAHGDENAKLFLSWALVLFAEHVLKYYEKHNPGDNSIRDCIETSKLYLQGKATIQELGDASEATYSATYSATYVARDTVQAARDTVQAVADVAYAARAAHVAEKEWQANKIKDLLTDETSISGRNKIPPLV
jgi:hypothetical protein